MRYVVSAAHADAKTFCEALDKSEGFPLEALTRGQVCSHQHGRCVM